MLGDEGETEAGADPMTGGAAAGEAFEDAVAFALRDAGPAVLDGESEPFVGGRRQLDAQCAATVVACVVEQVAENTFESDLVERDLGGCPRCDRRSARRAPRNVRRPVGSDR